MKLFYLYIVIIYSYIYHYTSFLSKILSIFYCFLYLFEYLFIFIFCNINIYYFILFRHWKKENYDVYKKLKKLTILNDNNYTKHNKYKEKKQDYKMMNKLLKLYYNRRMHLGITIVYIHIFFRKIKEKKNYFKYIILHGLKYKYNNLKKNIISNSLSFFFFFNYNLIFFLEYKKKKLLLFIFYFRFLILYSKIKIRLKVKQFFILLCNIKNLKWW